MANYKETNDTANTWTRCFRVIIDNPLEATPEVRFFEEDVVAMVGKTLRAPSSSAAASFDPQAMIQLRDTQTGELTGAYSTQAALYAILYSLYMQTALERDAAVVW